MIGWNVTSPTNAPFYGLDATATSPRYIDVEVLPRGLHWFLNSLMVLFTLLGLIGNGLICYFFIKRKLRLTAFNILLLNLSVADILADVFSYPHIFVDQTMLRKHSTSTTEVLCAFTIGTTSASVVSYVTVLTLTYISINRFVFVKFPLKTHWFKSRSYTLCMIVLMWTSAIFYMVPNFFTFHYDPKYALCYRDWPHNFNGFAWALIGGLGGLVLPLIALMATFILTMLHFRRTRTLTQIEARSARERGMINLLGYLILAYVVCWGPVVLSVFLSFAVESIWPPGPNGQFMRMRIIRVGLCFALLNTVIDPFIYGYKIPEVNKCFKDVFMQLRRFKKKSDNEEETML